MLFLQLLVVRDSLPPQRFPQPWQIKDGLTQLLSISQNCLSCKHPVFKAFEHFCHHHHHQIFALCVIERYQSKSYLNLTWFYHFFVYRRNCTKVLAIASSCLYTSRPLQTLCVRSVSQYHAFLCIVSALYWVMVFENNRELAILSITKSLWLGIPSCIKFSD